MRNRELEQQIVEKRVSRVCLDGLYYTEIGDNDNILLYSYIYICT